MSTATLDTTSSRQDRRSPSSSSAAASAKTPFLNWTFLKLEILRTLRDPSALVFILVLPTSMYILFGAMMSYGTYDAGAGKGNITMSIMITMACYGAVIATSGIGSTSGLERMQGWGRQLAITPMTNTQYILNKGIVASVLATLTVAFVYAVGYFTGAKADLSVWILSFIIAAIGSFMFALYGLFFGLITRSESAAGISGGLLAILGFFGNMFIPLTGTLLTIAKFTPLYGYSMLARFPLTDGYTIQDSTTGAMSIEPLWQSVANVVAWTVIFGALAWWASRKSTARQ